MDGPVIRPALVDDAEALADLHLDVWDEAYAGLMDQAILLARRAARDRIAAGWRDIVASGVGTTVVASDDSGRLVGFGSAAPHHDDSELPETEVLTLYVRAEMYGAGLGHALLGELVGADPAYLWVLDGNVRAIGFYERQGFVLDGATLDGREGIHRRMVRAAPRSS